MSAAQAEPKALVFGDLEAGDGIVLPGIGRVFIKSIRGRKVDLSVTLDRVRVSASRERRNPTSHETEEGR